MLRSPLPVRRKTPRTTLRATRRLRCEALERRAMLAAGDLDPTFGVGGIATTLIPGSAEDFIVDAVLQADGKIVVLGGSLDPVLLKGFAALARFNPDGTLDATFGDAGTVRTDFGGTLFFGGGLALDGDGKIVAAGSLDGDVLVARFNSDGSLDETFGTDGAVVTDLGRDDDVPGGIAIQPDGSVVVVGASIDNSTLDSTAFAARYTADGALDAAFDGDGIVVNLAGGSSAVDVLAFADHLLVSVTVDDNFGVARLNLDGSLDAAFGAGGVAVADLADPTIASALAVQADGAILVSAADVASLSGAVPLVARFSSGGALNAGFGDAGVATIDASAAGGQIVVQSDGRIAVALSTAFAFAGTLDFQIAMLAGDGSLDPAFGDAGIASGDFSTDEGAVALVQTLDGRLVAAGHVAQAASDDFGLVAFDADGLVDETFGDAGLASLDFPGHAFAVGDDVLIQSDGQIIVVGTDILRGLLVRLTDEGLLDGAFGTAGIAGVSTGGFVQGLRGDLQPDGRIIVAGTTDGGTGNQGFVARLDATGALDPSFAAGGLLLLSTGLLSESQLTGVVVLDSGKIAAVGAGPDGPIVVRLNSDGTLDDTFDTDGLVELPVAFGAAVGVIELSDGRLAVAGNTGGGEEFVAALDGPGALDAAFGDAGIATVNFFFGLGDEVRSLAEQSDGKILLVGSAPAAGGSSIVVARLDSLGVLDAGFGGDGIVPIDVPGVDARGADVVETVFGQIVFFGSGQLDSDPGLSAWVVGRLHSDGSPDGAFDGDGTAITPLGSFAQAGGIAIQSDGNIVVGGGSDGRIVAARYIDGGIGIIDPATIGGYDAASGFFFLRGDNSPGPADFTFGYGGVGGGIVPLAGDWDGDRVDTPGVYDPATGAFFLKNSNSAGPADIVFNFGAAGAGLLPLVGDWDGDGDDTIGLYDPANGSFFLRNENSPGNADALFNFGPGGGEVIAIVGDYNNDGATTIGIYNETTGTYFLKNGNTSGPANLAFGFGPADAGWQPLIGDWDNDGDETVGAYDPANGVYFLRDSNSPGAADTTVGYGPVSANWRPLVGAWIIALPLTSVANAAPIEDVPPQTVIDQIEEALGRALFVFSTTVPEQLDKAREVALEELDTAEDLLEEHADEFTDEQREDLFEQLAAARTAIDDSFDSLGHALEDSLTAIEAEFDQLLDLLAE